MKATVHITLKNGVLDPQGKAIGNALKNLGLSGIQDIRQGKYIELELAESNPEEARKLVEKACRDLLANTVMENYTITIEP